VSICKRCIVPSSYPGADLQDDECSFCRAYSSAPPTHREVLGPSALLTTLKTDAASNKWDCAVPLSGGKDSSYVLYHVVAELGLKPLALFFDNGFASDAAKRNVQSLCEQLQVELVSQQATRFRRALVSAAAERIAALPASWRDGHLCDNCENNLRAFVISETSRRGIPYVLWGSTNFEDTAADLASGTMFRDSYGATPSRAKWWPYAKNVLVTSAYLMYRDGGLPAAMRYFRSSVQCLYLTVRDNMETRAIKGLQVLDPFHQVSFRDTSTKLLHFFDYIPYDPRLQAEVLREKLHWEAPVDREIRLDCRLHTFANHWSLKNTGLTADGFTLATLARSGLITRDEAERKELAVRASLAEEYPNLLRDVALSEQTRISSRARGSLTT
jgi:hypothetical protein